MLVRCRRNAARRKGGIRGTHIKVGRRDQTANGRHVTVGSTRQQRIGTVITDRIIVVIEAQRLDAVERIDITACRTRDRQGTAGIYCNAVIGKVSVEDCHIVAAAVPVEDIAAFATDENILVVPTG